MKKRNALIDQLEQEEIWDIVIVGGGATGLGIALDAVTRGYKTLLLEQHDFAKGTSSRSTKLVHGGVRYMAQGDLALVKEACFERGLLLKNAPHLVKNQSFVIPNYSYWNNLKYTIGLKFYDFLAGKLSLGKSEYINKAETKNLLPTIKTEGLKGGVRYHDGQFDDSRLAVNIAQSAIENNACLLNYFKVKGLLKSETGQVAGVVAQDIETNKSYEIKAKSVINATGVFVDDVLLMDKPEARRIVRPSQGIHLMLDKKFLPGNDALMIPETSDGRVLFAVPWHDKLVVGTTDTLRDHPELEPHALEEEINFILNTAAAYLVNKPQRSDVLSVFVGLRPLAAVEGNNQSTKEISRSHKIIVSSSKLITITGGKWTTYRRMAQDTLEKAIKLDLLPNRPCVTQNFKIHGYKEKVDRTDPLYIYGSDKDALLQLSHTERELSEKLHPAHPHLKAEVVWCVRNEFARTVEDILSRRVRLLFLDARAAVEAAPTVARLIANELNKDENWINQQIADFTALAKEYILPNK
ncbi:glycerol-3-phosphate dehydrogenase/oxidase [Solitalea canadensis]|uniref:Glycerol-3-phosphate dehydrogenase n=1 Tax=Solitalea canadensis (strain ATCC 29591 / DSM 3403 / JCM 21819 / LMG 8368 / NBRC 15130 / NCIMB 12057 / USAM 9D) TaxID=929556 RepID=H8KWN4_SOLCM|nr:glycerol-3-phosphate dehydrogenase/oxidase [Solitalea canadensis]AFD08213.1 glycerol-3-phosphate dehydrogenase [Solitalea canadensis DSM 3403]